MDKISKFIIFTAILFGIFLRFWQLNLYPPSPNWDEVSIGYNAYSVLKTGKDEWGELVPTLFRAYGDYKLPLYIYLSVPFIALFGLNFFSIKIVSLISGCLLILVGYLILKKLSDKGSIVPLVGALIISLSPWSIFLSRIGLEANLFLGFFALSLYFILIKKFNASLILFMFCLFTYNSSRVILPVYLILLFLNRPLNLKPFSYLIFIFTIGIIFYQTFINQSGQSRYNLVTLIDQGAINRIESNRAQMPPILGKVIHNKATYFSYYSIKNYLLSIDPKFIFISGSSNYQFNIPNKPLLLIILIPFLGLGLIYLYKRNKQILLLYFLSPLPSAITRDAPHTLRLIIFLFLTTIIIALGFSQIKNRFILPILSTVLILGSLIFFSQYITYSSTYSWSWQYGYRQVVEYTKDNYALYEHIYITKKYGEPHEFILYYWPWDPRSYQNDPQKVWDYHDGWYWVDAFDKFKFVNDWEVISREYKPNSLLITSPLNYPSNATKLETIYFLDHTPAFDIVEL